MAVKHPKSWKKIEIKLRNTGNKSVERWMLHTRVLGFWGNLHARGKFFHQTNKLRCKITSSCAASDFSIKIYVLTFIFQKAKNIINVL